MTIKDASTVIRRERDRRRDQMRAASTLLEIMLAMSLLAIVIMATFSATGTAHQTGEATRDEVAVLEVVEGVIEEIQTKPYSEILGYNGKGYDVTGVGPGGDQNKVVELQVTEPYNGVIEVRIQAAWASSTGDRFTTISYLHVNRGA